MKHLIIHILLLAALVHSASAQQTNTKNYIISRTYKQAGADQNNVSLVDIQVQYLDGLGRPIQSVAVGQSPSGQDIVKPAAYDGLGRQANGYLPYVSTGNGSFKGTVTTPATSLAVTWYGANGAKINPSDLGHPYNETLFEASPLNRPSGVRAPGNKSAASSIVYKVNDGSEVKRYDYNGTTITENGTYASGSLTRQQSKDEQQHETNVYTDKLGQVVCKTVKASGSEVLSTYYVYDNLNQLRAVLQPGYQDAASLTDQAFTYDYDGLGRVITKRVPGAGLTEIVYDQYDRLALSRDANQQARGVWAFTKYDGLNRPVATGEIASSLDRVTWTANVNTAFHHEDRDNGSIAGYTLNKTAPAVSESDLMTITFYDDYNFTKASTLSYGSAYYGSYNANVKGLKTGSRARILVGTSAAAGDWLTAVTYYDTEYRPIQSVRQLDDLGSNAIERTSTEYKYNLAAVVSKQKTEQTVSTGTNIHLEEFTYDHADRLLGVKETVNFGAKTKTAYTVSQRYTPLGQLQSKWFHAYASRPTWYRRKTDYVSNIRGWMTNANSFYLKKEGDSKDSTFYGINLSYENAGSYTNGNIDRMLWRGKAVNAFTKGLDFIYDDANRLKNSTGVGGYADTESGISYDKNGNIKFLTRTGSVVDQLTYNYTSGNQLSSITDASGSDSGMKNGTSLYAYDANGNMTTDNNRGATLAYNYLNLPKTVSINGKTFAYDYDAAGNKHKYVSDTLTVKYAGIFEYNADNVLKRIATSEGQVVPSGDTLRFDYFLKDHLGNVRVVYNEAGKTLQLNDYYPFGLEIDRNPVPATTNELKAARNGVNRYSFQGQERQIGSDYIQFKWRLHDPLTGRFLSTDPLSEKFEYNSTYAFAENKVIGHIELEGLEAIPAQAQLYRAAGFSHQLNEKENSDLGIKLMGMWLEAQATVTLMMLPVEEAIVGLVGVAAKEAGLATKIERLTTKASILAENSAKGRSFEKTVLEDLIEKGNTDIVEQVTVKAGNGTKTKIDLLSKDPNGNIVLTEAKSSATAPLTKNQKSAFPSIQQSGGTVVGKGKPGFEQGTQIPPTQVEVVRPKEANQ